MRFSAALACALLLCGCLRRPPDFPSTTEEIVYQMLALSPVASTQIGYHSHKGVPLDSQMDDLSPAGLESQRKFFRETRDKLAAFDTKQLNAEDRADLDILTDLIAGQELELNEIQSFRHNPTVYVELIGNAVFAPYQLEYALKNKRYQDIIARLNKIPAFLDSAKANLVDSPLVWSEVAREENDGNIGLIDQVLRKEAPKELAGNYDKAAAAALDSLRKFNDWLRDDLSKRPSDWRLGKKLYDRKFQYALGLTVTPDELLKDAEDKLQAVRREMLELSRQLRPGVPSTDLNAFVSATLAKVAEKHATRETFFSDARRDLQEARDFVREKRLVTLPSRDNLQVIETPEFMRGIYGVGGFNPAPALEPQLGAYYWITPIPASWPAARIDSKLREYNFYGLKILTLHEAMPGHYVQAEYANQVQPTSRRLLRAVFGNTPYVEGWAVYASEMMLDQGYLDNSKEMRLTFQKQELRMLANTILDIRMQTRQMKDEEAMSLMLDQTFQEKEEAVAKLQRAKLSSTQLPSYYSGYREWVRLRDAFRKKMDTNYLIHEFHERALRAGAVSMKSLSRLMLE